MRPDNENEDLSYLIAKTIATVDPTLEERIETDPDAYLDLVVLTDHASRECVHLLDAAVASARSAGHSWDAIGKSLGMSRQAAQQRFGKGQRVEVSTGPGETRILRGLTAFNEMTVLNRAGRFGWHSFRNGVLFHELERSSEQWEHKRVLFISPRRKQLEEEGWQQAGEIWFPWAYYARPTGVPANMEDVSDAYLLSG